MVVLTESTSLKLKVARWWDLVFFSHTPKPHKHPWWHLLSQHFGLVVHWNPKAYFSGIPPRILQSFSTGVSLLETLKNYCGYTKTFREISFLIPVDNESEILRKKCHQKCLCSFGVCEKHPMSLASYVMKKLSVCIAGRFFWQWKRSLAINKLTLYN